MFTMNEIKGGLNIILHPIQATKKERGIKDSIKFYYKLSIIPLALFALFIFLSLLGTEQMLAVFIAVLIFQILTYWILVPIGLFISALIYHGIGKYLWSFKNKYANTFAATVYGIVPLVFFMWVPVIFLLNKFKIINNIIDLMFLAWSLIVLVIALANLQDTTKLRSVVVVFLAVLAILLILIFIMLRFHYSWIYYTSSLTYGINSALISVFDKLLYGLP